MFVSRTKRRAFAASAAIALLSGCGGQGLRFAPPPSNGAGTSYRARTAEKPGYNGSVFVSDVSNDSVWICPANFHDIRNGFTFPTGQLFGVSSPVQIAVDSSGTVYVANSLVDASGAGSITEYPRGQTSPSRTLTSGLYSTSGVAVDSAGSVYASNKFLGSIEVFPKGKSAPTATITANLTGPDGLAADKAGNLFIADSSANDVLKLAHGRKPRSRSTWPASQGRPGCRRQPRHALRRKSGRRRFERRGLSGGLKESVANDARAWSSFRARRRRDRRAADAFDRSW